MMVSKRWLLVVMIVLSMVVMPGVVSAKKEDNYTKTYINLFDFRQGIFFGLFNSPVDEITLHENKKMTVFASIYCISNESNLVEYLMFRFINFEVLDSNETILSKGRGMPYTIFIVPGVINAKYGIGPLKEGEYNIKASYGGNVKNKLSPSVKYVKLHVIK